ncbi:MAG: IPT/TIG domain-containing protein [Nitrospira sp.]|uniref:IPT/TIG domain-containing protein n=1 Tax=Nitrospira defluvii TaxID=330214 RepID=A0ABM8QBZ3_9BACT|nr:IPT/TIG domain-containing protein [Nitrospira defluvii]MCS6326987.1 IPT/TIG domain-containing protein [Nitrospira sp.]CAE6688514.1 IPT/TIG domain-containing protein [Nitrospira defluvii]
MRTYLPVFLGSALAFGLSLVPFAPGHAQEGAMVEGAGYTMFNTESIKGSDTSKLEKDPVCDRSKRPSIGKVEPDEAKPGDKVTIKGENFGSKECFHGVTFSAAPKDKIDYQFVNETTIEAVVPEAKAGMSFIIVVAGGGSAQSKPLLIHAK